MRTGEESQVSPVELVNTLQRNRTAFFGSEPDGDLLPRFALAALLADEFDVRFESAVKGRTAAGLRASFLCRAVHGSRIHRHEITVGRVPGVSEQWVSSVKWWQSLRKQPPRATLTGVERVNASQQIVESEIGRPRSYTPTITSRRD